MRARNFRPTFDRLGSRIALSDGTGIAGAVASTGDGVDVVGTINWYIDGNPPCSTDNPLDPSIDLDDLVTNCSSTT
jgi:hypothetical protein